MRVMDHTRTAPRLSLDVDWAPSYELLMSLAAFSDTEIQATFDSGSLVFDQLRTQLSSDLTGVMELLKPQGVKQGGALIGLAWHEHLREPEELIDRLQKMSPTEFALILLGSRWPTIRAIVPPEVFLRAARGEREALDELVRLTRQVESEDEDVERRLEPLRELGPAGTHLAFVELLRRWNEEVFATQRR